MFLDDSDSDEYLDAEVEFGGEWFPAKIKIMVGASLCVVTYNIKAKLHDIVGLTCTLPQDRCRLFDPDSMVSNVKQMLKIDSFGDLPAGVPDLSDLERREAYRSYFEKAMSMIDAPPSPEKLTKHARKISVLKPCSSFSKFDSQGSILPAGAFFESNYSTLSSGFGPINSTYSTLSSNGYGHINTINTLSSTTFDSDFLKYHSRYIPLNDSEDPDILPDFSMPLSSPDHPSDDEEHLGLHFVADANRSRLLSDVAARMGLMNEDDPPCFTDSASAREWAESFNYDFEQAKNLGLAIFPGSFCPPNEHHLQICQSVLKNTNIFNVWMDLSATKADKSQDRYFQAHLLTLQYPGIDIAKLSIFLGENAWRSDYFKTLSIFAGRIYWVMGNDVFVKCAKNPHFRSFCTYLEQLIIFIKDDSITYGDCVDLIRENSDVKDPHSFLTVKRLNEVEDGSEGGPKKHYRYRTVGN